MINPASHAPPPLALLEIDLDSAARNYLFLAKKLAPGADCAAVVKADAYGLGALPVAAALYRHNCRHFFVATFDEGQFLRTVLPATGPEAAAIYVLHGPHGGTLKDFDAATLTPVLNTPGDIAALSDHAKMTGKKQPAILHLDTGMNRLGLSSAEAAAADVTGLTLKYVMSHLACADEPAHPMNAAQLETFKAASSRIAPARRSFANSGGIFLGEDYHFDLARPGCAIYGMNPKGGGSSNPMHPVVSLHGLILQVRDITESGTVGYGATRAVAPPARTATISLGYADGFFRSLSNRGAVFIGGLRCPVLGRVSMDTIVVDATALPIPPKPGDYAEILGASQSVDALAADAGTIGYEVLTALGGRYKRMYTGNVT